MKDGDSFPLSPDEVRMIESHRATAAMLVDDITLTVGQRKAITVRVLDLIRDLTQLAGTTYSADSKIHEVINILARDDG